MDLVFRISFFFQEATNLLLKAGADPNIINRVFKTSPLHVAARKGNLQILDAVRWIIDCCNNLI